MLSREEFNRLSRLLNHLYLCTGIKFALMDERGEEVYTSSYRAPFCSMIMSERPECCYTCDREAVGHVCRTGQDRRYMCHAGLYEVAMPVTENGQVVAIVLFGQMLDDTPREAQWARVRSRCGWHSDPEGLHQAFLHLRRVSSVQMDACAEIVRACVSEVRLRTSVSEFTADDAVRLRSYIETHYAEALNTERLSAELHVGRTRLNALCSETFHTTPMRLVTQVRIEAAKDLLRTTSESMRAIGQAVGFPDQNYFTKVFRRETGCTPSEFRMEAAGSRPEN